VAVARRIYGEFARDRQTVTLFKRWKQRAIRQPTELFPARAGREVGRAWAVVHKCPLRDFPGTESVLCDGRSVLDFYSTWCIPHNGDRVDP
jgi:hypothetical protein